MRSIVYRGNHNFGFYGLQFIESTYITFEIYSLHDILLYRLAFASDTYTILRAAAPRDFECIPEEKGSF